MIRHQISRRVLRVTFAVAASAAAFGTIGAASYEWSPIPKGDRVSSVADCRLASMREDPACQGVVLPATTAEAIDVAPGLSVVEQIRK